VTVEEMPEAEVTAESSKVNLKKSLKVELSEIDNRYPEYLERIEPEGYTAAINDLTYAWKAEQQHRELLKKVQSALGLFFGKVVNELEAAESYFVCQRCGSTLIELH